MSDQIDIDEMCAAAYGDGFMVACGEVVKAIDSVLRGMERRGETVTCPETTMAIDAIASWAKMERDYKASLRASAGRASEGAEGQPQ